MPNRYSYRFLLGNVLFWLAITLISATILYVFFGANYDGTWFNFFFRQLPIWLVWMLITPIIFWTIKNRKPRSIHWLEIVIRHVLLVAFMTLCFQIMYNAFDWFYGDKSFSLKQLLTNSNRNFVLNFMMHLLIYLLVITVAYGFDWYLALKKSQVEKAAVEKQLIQAQLDALNMQLRPHFLFNALNTIASLVRKQENVKAVQAISDLGDLLRQSLKQQKGFLISLEEELMFIDKYLEIECLRHQDRLTYQREVSNESLVCQVPAFILQPLVENALIHGIAQTEKNGVILVKTHCLNGTLQVEITDNGIGLPRHFSIKESGIGLSNVVERLRYIYGDQFDLNLQASEEGGTRVTLSIPRSH